MRACAHRLAHRATVFVRIDGLLVAVANTEPATQVDMPGGRSGLDGLEELLAGIDSLTFVHLTSRDVVRHRIVADIVNAYERAGARPRSGHDRR